MQDTVLRFTIPTGVALEIDLPAIEHRLREVDGVAFGYRRETLPGIEIGCSAEVAAVIIGALRNVAGNGHGSGESVDLLAKLLDLLSRESRSAAPSVAADEGDNCDARRLLA